MGFVLSQVYLQATHDMICENLLNWVRRDGGGGDGGNWLGSFILGLMVWP